MKITERIEEFTIRMLNKTIELQKKQITTHKNQIKRHERLLKQVMQEAGYPSWKITAIIMANYKEDDEQIL
jgi:hypothetical protein